MAVLFTPYESAGRWRGTWVEALESASCFASTRTLASCSVRSSAGQPAILSPSADGGFADARATSEASRADGFRTLPSHVTMRCG